MAIACPVCRVENTTGPNCRRCKADLSMLFTLEQERTALLAQISEAIRQERWTEGMEILPRMEEIRSDVESKKLRSLLFLMQAKWSDAFSCYLQVTNNHG